MNNPISVSELNSYLKLKIESDSSFHNICVRGEISNLRVVTSGHIYFSLKDNNSVIKSIMFKGYTSKLRFSLSDGMKVLVECSVSFYV